MNIRSLLSKPLAAYAVYKQKRWLSKPIQTQARIYNYLIREGKNTLFGREHCFLDIRSYSDWKKNVPIRGYEELSPYIEKIAAGHSNILWPGKPLYFAKTSGTTSGTKYIPITKDSLSNHIDSARNALFCYIHETNNSAFLDKKLIFLSGSPELVKKNNIPTGRLSGIVNHHVPNYLRVNQLPTYSTNCIVDWEEKLEKIIDETLTQPMSLISGIPPWVQMYFDKIQQYTGKKIKEVFPYFSLFVHGGVNFEPYSDKLYDTIGKKIDTIETYPASEGFLAYQDSQTEKGMLLLLNSGIFFEFIPTTQYLDKNPIRLNIEEIEVGKNYALILNSNAGLWGYDIGDTVQFVSKNPPRIMMTGRIKHFLSAFGEHVIGKEVEDALKYAMRKHPEVSITEFSVAPQIDPSKRLTLS